MKRYFSSYRGATSKQMLIGTVAVLVIIGALLSIFLQQCQRTSQVDMTPFRAIGEGVGQETLRLLGGAGKVVVLMWGNEQNRSLAAKTMLNGFEKALKKNPAVTLTAVETYAGDEYRSQESFPALELMLELKQKHSQADVLVSFVGLPLLEPGDYEKLPARPKLIAVTSDQADSRALLAKGIVDALIVSRQDFSPATAPKPKTGREWFEQHYQVLTSPKR
jgi:hypothetical protein